VGSVGVAPKADRLATAPEPGHGSYGVGPGDVIAWAHGATGPSSVSVGTRDSAPGCVRVLD
jgi:hypothetical protein